MPRTVEKPDAAGREQRAEEGDTEDGLAARAAALLDDDAIDGGFLGLDVTVQARVLRERRKLVPVLDGALVVAECVAQDVRKSTNVCVAICWSSSTALKGPWSMPSLTTT